MIGGAGAVRAHVTASNQRTFPLCVDTAATAYTAVALDVSRGPAAAAADNECTHATDRLSARA